MRKYLLSIAYALSTSFSQAQIVNIPDANFNAALLAYDPIIDINNDKLIQVSEAKMVKSLVLQSKSISDLTGIESFTALTELICDQNLLNSLNLSNNNDLRILWCGGNKLDTLDVSNLYALEQLYCEGNKLTRLNVRNNTALTSLSCSYCNVSTFDLSKNTKLKSLVCKYTKLTTLDITNNTELEYLDCSNNQLSFLNVSKNILLDWLDCNNNFLAFLDVSKNAALRYIISYNNQLSTLDVSKNIALENLQCFDNPNLTTICINYEQQNIIKDWDKDLASDYSISCIITSSEEQFLLSNTTKLIRIVNSLGQEISPENTNGGVFIYQYNDGSSKIIANKGY